MTLVLVLLACHDDGLGRLAQPGPTDSADTGVSDDGDSGETGEAGDTGETGETVGDTGVDSSPDSGDTGPPPPTCGDGTCSGDESCWDCAADCGSCDCPEDVDVVFYAPSAWNVLADAMDADPSPCADYHFALPANADDKTTPRGGGEPEAIRARSPRLHAMAEAHWSGWSAVEGSWYEKGVEFRRRMAKAGYDVAAGDSWAVNELPSSVRTDAATRQDALDFFEGLYDGPDHDGVKGTVFTVGMGHDTTNFAEYKPNVEDWLEDADFWASANLHVVFWAQEVYADPHLTCVDGTTVAEKSTSLNTFAEHVAWHAEVGPDSANTAQSYLGRAYLPLMNAVWNSDGNGYGDTTVDLETMEHFVSQEVYAARAWSGDHNHPDGRLGFAWARYDTDDADLAVLAGRLASAIHYAYDEGGGSAAGACSPSGAYTWCQCAVDGAAFNEGWATFGDW